MVGVSIVVREIRRSKEWVRVQLFAGRNPGSRDNVGSLLFFTDQWEEIRERIVAGEWPGWELATSTSQLRDELMGASL